MLLEHFITMAVQAKPGLTPEQLYQNRIAVIALWLARPEIIAHFPEQPTPEALQEVHNFLARIDQPALEARVDEFRKQVGAIL